MSCFYDYSNIGMEDSMNRFIDCGGFNVRVISYSHWTKVRNEVHKPFSWNNQSKECIKSTMLEF